MAAGTLAPTSRAPGTRRANRTVLALIGLVLLAAGAAGIAAGTGLFGDRVRTDKVIPQDTRDWVAEHDWFWLAVAAAGILLALLALRWLLAQASTNRVSYLDVESDRSAGRTVLSGGAVTDAVAAEIGSYRGVAGASAHLLGTRGAPTLLLHITLDGRGDPAEVRTRIQAEAVAHVRQALDAPDLPVRLELRLAGASRRDLR
jgi:hypothetical protein